MPLDDHPKRTLLQNQMAKGTTNASKSMGVGGSRTSETGNATTKPNATMAKC